MRINRKYFFGIDSYRPCFGTQKLNSLRVLKEKDIRTSIHSSKCEHSPLNRSKNLDLIKKVQTVKKNQKKIYSDIKKNVKNKPNDTEDLDVSDEVSVCLIMV